MVGRGLGADSEQVLGFLSTPKFKEIPKVRAEFLHKLVLGPSLEEIGTCYVSVWRIWGPRKPLEC